MQLRLGLEGEAEIPEVWATLGAAARCEVIERLAQAMVNAIGAPSGQGGEQPAEYAVDQAHEDGQGRGENATRIV